MSGCKRGSAVPRNLNRVVGMKNEPSATIAGKLAHAVGGADFEILAVAPADRASGLV
jgi:hypothetical protein